MLASPERLDGDARADVRALAAAVEAEDGQPPLSDQALAQLSSASLRHVVASTRSGAAAATLVGYAQLGGDSLEIVGSVASLGPLLDEFAGSTLLVWTHGSRSRLAPVLSARSFREERSLLQLRRPLGAVGAERAVPRGVRIAPFRVGRDEDAWVRVNAAAFADHPEQGRWTRSDLEAREAEPWFEPAGFLLAWRDEQLLGSHWTKIHSAGLGEVYVIGVDPAGQGLGLGGVLLERGLEFLRSRGCSDVLLYVDESNAAARRLYERTGFTEYDRDTQWRSPAPGA